MKIKEILKKNQLVNRQYIKYKWRKRKVSYGEEHPEKTYYLIRRTPGMLGLFSYVATNLGHIKYAVDHGYIPVIDMQNYENTYLPKSLLGKENAWEYFFEQPVNISLLDIEHSKNVILSWAESPKEYPGADMTVDADQYAMWKAYADQYLKIKPEIRAKIDQTYDELSSGKKMLGVLCRGTDYTKGHPSRHPIQPELGDLIKKADEMMLREKCELVYLATEDEDVCAAFSSHYKEKLRTMDMRRFHANDIHNINEAIFRQEDTDSYQKGVEYLVNIGVLSKCSCLTAGCSGGTYGALLLTKGYDSTFVFNLGYYP